MTPEEREEAVTTAMLLHIEPDGDGFVHVHQNDVWNAVATAHDAAILAERERCARVIMREILDDAEVYEAENHNATIKLFAAAIREEPTDD